MNIGQQAAFLWLCAAYPDKTIPPETGVVYQETLGHIDPECLLAAAKEHVLQSKWFPTVSELLERCAKLAPRYARVTHPEDAWEIAKDIMNGNTSSGNAADAIRHAMVCVGGIQISLPEGRALFLRAYGDLTRGLRYHPPHGTLAEGKSGPLKSLPDGERNEG